MSHLHRRNSNWVLSNSMESEIARGNIDGCLIFKVLVKETMYQKCNKVVIYGVELPHHPLGLTNRGRTDDGSIFQL